MELEVDLPNYLYDKPDDYYAKDVNTKQEMKPCRRT